MTASEIDSYHDIKEQLKNQLEQAFYGYGELRNAAPKDMHGKDVPKADKDTFMREANEFIAEMEKDGTTFARYRKWIDAAPEGEKREVRIAAWPNAEYSEEQDRQAAEKFGETQPYNTYDHDKEYPENKIYAGHTPEQVSGKMIDGELVRFFLYTNKPDLACGTLDEQIAEMEKEQATTPSLDNPYDMETRAIWYAERKENQELKGDGVSEATIYRDLKGKPVADPWGGRVVAEGCVSNLGEPCRDGSSVGSAGRARLVARKKI
ncbi:MAG: hypothetical protein LBC95_00710 [Candidatus Nomurabacteria bacterium]|jgi:hypothetical protein|nr:hypothetical protein [Candidatus Nomurabacteria bacterium]